MRRPGPTLLREASLLVALVAMACGRASAQDLRLESLVSVAGGVHLWYEIKADSEAFNNLIICGTKWDARTNGPYGFVYASSDSGASWAAVLEDRNSLWVTEHSCAFGPSHRAYFISEASKVFDGQQHHELGVTRLYVSEDAGKHWKETSKTGWADFSTSAVSSSTGKLYTFFNNPSTRNPGRNRGSTVGLLVFSPDGMNVEGTFFDPEMRNRGYRDAYPSDAVSLADGQVAALYYGVRQTKAGGLERELGFIRAGTSSEPLLERTVILGRLLQGNCLGVANYSLAYDQERNRLSAVYVEGCGSTRIMMTSSGDEGRTWTKGVVIAEQGKGRRAMYPSVVAISDGKLGLLWCESNDRAARWLFAQFQGAKTVSAPIELESASDFGVSADALWTTIHRSKKPSAEANAWSASEPIVVGMRSLAEVVWRDSALLARRDEIVAVWPSRSDQGMQLDFGVIGNHSDAATKTTSSYSEPGEYRDVTQDSLITYAGGQAYDRTTGTLAVCLKLENRGRELMQLPLKLKAISVESPAGPVAILNASNGLGGAGAVWNISGSITGNRLDADTSTGPFCLRFRLQGRSRGERLIPENLIELKIRVLSANSNHSKESKE